MSKSVITSIHYSSAHVRKKPKAADLKFLKGRGVWMIRQQVYSDMYRAWVVSNGRPVWEWVEKDGERDRAHAWSSKIAENGKA